MARYRHKAIGGLVKMLMIMTITIVKKGGHWPRCPGQRTPFQVEQWDCLPPRPHYHILQSPLLILHSALEPSLWWFIDANLIFWRFVSVKFAPDIFQTLLGWIGSSVKTDRRPNNHQKLIKIVSFGCPGSAFDCMALNIKWKDVFFHLGTRSVWNGLYAVNDQQQCLMVAQILLNSVLFKVASLHYNWTVVPMKWLGQLY